MCTDYNVSTKGCYIRVNKNSPNILSAANQHLIILSKMQKISSFPLFPVNETMTTFIANF